MTDSIIKRETFAPIEARFTELIDKATFTKEVSFALQHIQKNPQLMKCVPETILQAVMNIAQVGLTLNPVASEAYLVPRWSKNGIMCVLEPSYQGLCKLLTDTGSVSRIYSHVVYKGDDFEVSLGSETRIIHKPKFSSSEITHAYAVGELETGKQIEVITKTDLDFIRGKSESYKAYKADKVKTCVWVEWESEMCRKVVIKRLCKYLPRTDKWDKVSEAISLDNNDYQLDIASGKATFIFSLIDSSVYDEDKKQDIEREIYGGISENRANDLITQLKEDQLNPVTQGRGYSVTDAKNEVARKLDEPEKLTTKNK